MWAIFDQLTLKKGQIMSKQNTSSKGWKSSLAPIIRANNSVSSDGAKRVGFGTQQARSETLFTGFKEIRELGFKLNSVEQFKERHMTALANHWERRGLSSSTIQNRISHFRTFSGWIGKEGMVRGAENYVKNPESVERHLVAQTDRTWSGQGVNIEQKISQVTQLNPSAGIQLELQRAFGLRMKEAALMKPHPADRGAYLQVNHGTKGGRDRVVDIENAYQRDVLDRAKAIAGKQGSSTIPENKSYAQWRNIYNYTMKKSGITKENGITSHGLRHERLNEVYRAKTGHDATIKGGVVQNPLADKIARQEVAEVAGHSREAIASAYLGGK